VEHDVATINQLRIIAASKQRADSGAEQAQLGDYLHFLSRIPSAAARPPIAVLLPLLVYATFPLE
jgi:hypothetical protein